MTTKAGVDITPYFNVEGFVRQLYRNGQTDPQDPFFLNNGLVVDAPGYNTRTDETLARVEGTLKLFEDRWIQSAKWTGSRNGVTGFENFMQASASLGTAQTLTYKSSVLLDSNFAGGETHRITGLLESQRQQFSFDSFFLFGPDLEAARNGYQRTTNSVGGEYVLDVPRTGTTISIAQRQDFNEPFEDEYTWRYSISQKLGMTGARLHSSVGRGVTNPSFIEQFGFIVSTFQPNPNLVPESSIGWDAGWEQQFWNDRVLVDVTYFNSRLEHEIVLRSLPNFKTTVENLTGPSTRQGVEVTGSSGHSTGSRSPGPTPLLTRATTRAFRKSTPSPRSISLGHRTVRPGARQGNRQRHLQRPDHRHDLHLPVVDHHAECLHAGRRHDLLRHDAVVDGLPAGRDVFDRRYEEVFSYRSPGGAVYAGVKVRTN